MKKYISVLIGLSIVTLLLYYIHNQKVQIGSLQNVTNEQRALIDSLRDELFIEHTTLDRYDIGLEKLREMNPKAAEQFEDCLSNTE